MLTYLRTSLLKSDAQTVVNTVNTEGVMGKGIAKAFRERYPEMYRQYRELCKAGRFKIGQLWLWKGHDQWVLNFPTKSTWRRPSQVSYIEAGLRKFVESYEERGITEISFPRLGCGNGGLNWDEQVRPLMERYLSALPIPVYIHDYHVDLGLPEHQESKTAAFDRSYDSFFAALERLAAEREGRFHTVGYGSEFQARIVERALEIRRSKECQRVTIVDPDELQALWSLLLKGPVTKRNLMGKAHDEAYYVFAVVSSLPFVRPIQVQPRKASQGMIGIELLERTNLPSTAPDDTAGSQRSLAWA